MFLKLGKYYSHLGDKLAHVKALDVHARLHDTINSIDFDVSKFPFRRAGARVKLGTNRTGIDVEDIDKQASYKHGNIVGHACDNLKIVTLFDKYIFPHSVMNVPAGKIKISGKYVTFQQYSYFQGYFLNDAYWQSIVDSLTATGLKVVYVGNPKDVKSKLNGVDYCLENIPDPYESLMESMSLIANANCHIGGDSAMTHFAIMYGTPRITLLDPKFGAWQNYSNEPSIEDANFKSGVYKLCSYKTEIKDIADIVCEFSSYDIDKSPKNILVKYYNDQRFYDSVISYRMAYPTSNLYIDKDVIDDRTKQLCAVYEVDKIDNSVNYDIVDESNSLCLTIDGKVERINITGEKFEYLTKYYGRYLYDDYSIVKQNNACIPKYKNCVNVAGKDSEDILIVMSSFGDYDELRFNAMRRSYERLKKQSEKFKIIFINAGDERMSSVYEGSDNIIVNLKLSESNKGLFQKECLWNYAITHFFNVLNNHAKYILFMDNDISCSDETWLSEVKEILHLNDYSVVYGSYNADFNSETQEVKDTRIMASNFRRINACMHPEVQINPGGVMSAMTIDTYNYIGGFNPYGFDFAGDTLIYYEIDKNYNDKNKIVNFAYPYNMNDSSHLLYGLRKPIDNVSIITTSHFLLHEWHGNQSNRKYDLKGKVLKYANVNPHDFIELDENGLLKKVGFNKVYEYYKANKNKLVDVASYIYYFYKFYKENNLLFCDYFDESFLAITSNTGYSIVRPLYDDKFIMLGGGKVFDTTHAMIKFKNHLHSLNIEKATKIRLTIQYSKHAATDVVLRLYSASNTGIPGCVSYSSDVELHKYGEIINNWKTYEIPLSDFSNVNRQFISGVVFSFNENFLRVKEIQFV